MHVITYWVKSGHALLQNQTKKKLNRMKGI